MGERVAVVPDGMEQEIQDAKNQRQTDFPRHHPSHFKLEKDLIASNDLLSEGLDEVAELKPEIKLPQKRG